MENSQIHKADRRITLKEFIEKIFGGIKIQNQRRTLEEELKSLSRFHKPDNKYALLIKIIWKRISPTLKSEILLKPKITAVSPPIQRLRWRISWLERLARSRAEYVKDYVSINAM